MKTFTTAAELCHSCHSFVHHLHKSNLFLCFIKCNFFWEKVFTPKATFFGADKLSTAPINNPLLSPLHQTDPIFNATGVALSSHQIFTHLIHSASPQIVQLWPSIYWLSVDVYQGLLFLPACPTLDVSAPLEELWSAITI